MRDPVDRRIRLWAAADTEQDRERSSINTRFRTTGTPGDDTERLWAIVLAAGDGKRLAPLTRALYGRELPKQFAVLHRGRSLLQTTMDRVAPLVPPERTVVVVGRAHEGLARRQIAE